MHVIPDNMQVDVFDNDDDDDQGQYKSYFLPCCWREGGGFSDATLSLKAACKSQQCSHYSASEQKAEVGSAHDRDNSGKIIDKIDFIGALLITHFTCAIKCLLLH